MESKSLIEKGKLYQEQMNKMMDLYSHQMTQKDFEYLRDPLKNRKLAEAIEYEKLTNNQKKVYDGLTKEKLMQTIKSTFASMPATDKDESAYHVFGGRGAHEAYNKAMKNELLKWQNNSK